MAHKTNSPDEHDELLHILGARSLIGMEFLRRIDTDDVENSETWLTELTFKKIPNPPTNAQGDSTYESSNSPARRSTRRLAHRHGGCSSISRRGGYCTRRLRLGLFELAARCPFFTPRPAVIAVVVAEANSTLCPGVGGGGPVENSITPPSSNVCNPVAIPFRKLCNPWRASRVRKPRPRLAIHCP